MYSNWTQNLRNKLWNPQMRHINIQQRVTLLKNTALSKFDHFLTITKLLTNPVTNNCLPVEISNLNNRLTNHNKEKRALALVNSANRTKSEYLYNELKFTLQKRNDLIQNLISRATSLAEQIDESSREHSAVLEIVKELNKNWRISIVNPDVTAAAGNVSHFIFAARYRITLFKVSSKLWGLDSHGSYELEGLVQLWSHADKTGFIPEDVKKSQIASWKNSRYNREHGLSLVNRSSGEENYLFDQPIVCKLVISGPQSAEKISDANAAALAQGSASRREMSLLNRYNASADQLRFAIYLPKNLEIDYRSKSQFQIFIRPTSYSLNRSQVLNSSLVDAPTIVEDKIDETMLNSLNFNKMFSTNVENLNAVLEKLQRVCASKAVFVILRHQCLRILAVNSEKKTCMINLVTIYNHLSSYSNLDVHLVDNFVLVFSKIGDQSSNKCVSQKLRDGLIPPQFISISVKSNDPNFHFNEFGLIIFKLDIQVSSSNEKQFSIFLDNIPILRSDFALRLSSGDLTDHQQSLLVDFVWAPEKQLKFSSNDELNAKLLKSMDKYEIIRRRTAIFTQSIFLNHISYHSSNYQLEKVLEPIPKHQMKHGSLLLSAVMSKLGTSIVSQFIA